MKLTGLVYDATCAVRTSFNRRWATLLAILTIAVGAAATSTIFALWSAVVLRPLPWPAASRLVRAAEFRQGKPGRLPWTISNGTYLAWEGRHDTLEAIGAWRHQAMTMTGAGDATHLEITWVTPSLLGVLQAKPALGRGFGPEDGQPGRQGVVILAADLWRERFGEDAAAVGRVVQLDGQPFVVIGVMPRGFLFPDRRTRAWIAWSVPSVVSQQGGRAFTRMVIVNVLGRLRTDRTAAQAAEEATSRGRSAPDAGTSAVAMFGATGPIRVTVVPAQEVTTAAVRPAADGLMLAVLLLFAVGTGNLALLRFSQSTAKAHEFAIRSYLGASRRHLVRLAAAETVVVAMAGTVAALVVTDGLLHLLIRALPEDFPRLEAVAFDGWAIACAAAASVVMALLGVLLPVLLCCLGPRAASRVGKVSWGRATTRLRSASMVIMVGEVAASCVLLVGATELGRSFLSSLTADRGFITNRVLTARLPIPRGYPVTARAQITDRVLARLAAVPGVVDVAVANAVPFMSTGDVTAFRMPSWRDPGASVDVPAVERVVSPSYFRTLGIRLVEGRLLSEADTETSRPVAVVNRALAREYLGPTAVGRLIPAGLPADVSSWEVVGVVEDIRQDDPSAPTPPEVLVSYRQVPIDRMRVGERALLLRTSGDPLSYATTLARIVREEDSKLALYSVRTMEDRLAESLARPRSYAGLVAAFASASIAVALVGLLGVLSISVAQRTKEFAVRMALGAAPADISRLVLRQAATIAAAGVIIGCALAWAGSVLLSRITGEPTSGMSLYLGVAAFVTGASMAACWGPVRRAASVAPASVLRLAE